MDGNHTATMNLSNVGSVPIKQGSLFQYTTAEGKNEC